MKDKALFLDRDGVINIEKEYVYKKEEFDFINDIFDICLFFQQKGFRIFVVTNQSGIARDYYTEDDFNLLTSWMKKEFLKHGIIISAVYHCPHHPNITGICDCRKPQAGMLFQARKEFEIDLENSIIIGDKERDIEAGLNAGLKYTYLLDVEMKTQSSKAKRIISNLGEIYVDFK